MKFTSSLVNGIVLPEGLVSPLVSHVIGGSTIWLTSWCGDSSFFIRRSILAASISTMSIYVFLLHGPVAFLPSNSSWRQCYRQALCLLQHRDRGMLLLLLRPYDHALASPGHGWSFEWEDILPCYGVGILQCITGDVPRLLGLFHPRVFENWKSCSEERWFCPPESTRPESIGASIPIDECILISVAPLLWFPMQREWE